MSEAVLDIDEIKAVGVLLRTTMEVVGPEAAVVSSLQRLIRERTRLSYRAAELAFDALPVGQRQRISDRAPTLARRRLESPNLPGLLRVLNRTAGQAQASRVERKPPTISQPPWTKKPPR
jgi:hypothetical protein